MCQLWTSGQTDKLQKRCITRRAEGGHATTERRRSLLRIWYDVGVDQLIDLKVLLFFSRDPSLLPLPKYWWKWFFPSILFRFCNSSYPQSFVILLLREMGPLDTLGHEYYFVLNVLFFIRVGDVLDFISWPQLRSFVDELIWDTYMTSLEDRHRLKVWEHLKIGQIQPSGL